MAKTYDYLFRLLLLGDQAVGKTCIILRFTDQTFSSLYINTIGIDFKIRTIELDGKTIRLQVWDTAGQERFRSITTSYYRGAMGIFLVYDITNEESFRHITHWMKSIEETERVYKNCVSDWNVDQHASADVEKIILGNKCDKDLQRQVTKEKGQLLAIEHGVKFMETSAKAGNNVEEAFFMMVRDIKIKTEKLNAENSTKGSGYHRNANKPAERKIWKCLVV